MIALAIGVLMIFAVPKWFQHTSLFTRLYDTGIYHNLVWNIANGNGFWSNVLDRNHLGEHVSPIVAGFAPLYWMVPDARWLLVAQGLALGATVLLAGYFASVMARDLGRSPRRWLVAVAMLMAALYRPFLGAYGFEFQPINLGMPMVLAGLIALATRRWWLLAATVLLLMTTRESAALTLVGLGLVAALRFRQYKVSAVLMVAAGVFAVVGMQVIMPMFRGDVDWGHNSRVGPLLDWGTKWVYVFSLVAWLGFMPLLGWRVAISALPGAALNLMVHYQPQYSMNFHYDAQLGVFLVAGGVEGLVRLAPRIEAVAGWLGGAWSRRRQQWAVAGSIATLGLGTFLLVRPVLPEQGLVARMWTGRVFYPGERRRAIIEAIAQLRPLPGELMVMGPHTGPQFAGRDGITPILTQYEEYDIEIRPGLWVWSSVDCPLWLRERMQTGPEFEVIYESEHVLKARVHPPAAAPPNSEPVREPDLTNVSHHRDRSSRSVYVPVEESWSNVSRVALPYELN